MEKDRTVKLRAYAEAAANTVVPPAKPAEVQGASAELAKKEAQLEEEKNRTLELLKTIVQLRESLKQEQAKSADLDAKLNRLAAVEENQLARKNAQLEEEKRQSLEQLSMIEQLRESLRQEQAKSAGAADRTAELEAKAKAVAALEARVRDLSVLLNKISNLAAAAKPLGDA